MKYLKKIFFVLIILKFFKINKRLSFEDLNFKLIDFNNYQQIKSFIFKKKFFKLKNKYVQSFDFLNFSKKLGGKIGINLSKNTIFEWYNINRNKVNFPWSDDLTSKRLINIIYNYEFINSSSTKNENVKLLKIVNIHMYRVIFDFKNKNIGELTSYDFIAYLLSFFILENKNNHDLNHLISIIDYQIDNFGMHKSYNLIEHSRFINNLNQAKNIFLFFNHDIPKKIDDTIIKMNSTLNEYFHSDGTIPLFNGSNNNYTKNINNSLNKDIFLKSRKFTDNNNGIAYYKDKNKSIFFDVVQPNEDKISSNLSAGTLSFEFSGLGEKIITNCGASESFGKNPEYLRYSAAHSTIILQNTNISEIKENNPHVKFPQSVTFNSSSEKNKTIFEGSHNGYLKKFHKIVKRNIIVHNNEEKISGEDSLISLKDDKNRIVYHIRFHLVDGINFNFTNGKKNIILKTRSNNIWLFKNDGELFVEDSILVDNNVIKPTKQIVIKGMINKKKQVRKWSLEKI